MPGELYSQKLLFIHLYDKYQGIDEYIHHSVEFIKKKKKTVAVQFRARSIFI